MQRKIMYFIATVISLISILGSCYLIKRESDEIDKYEEQRIIYKQEIKELPKAEIVVQEVEPEVIEEEVPVIEEKPKYESLGVFRITAYCPCPICTENPNGSHATASGAYATAGRTIAAPRSIPFGTKLMINGHEYIVEDRGGAIGEGKLDIFFDTHEEANAWGVRSLEVFIVNE